MWHRHDLKEMPIATVHGMASLAFGPLVSGKKQKEAVLTGPKAHLSGRATALMARLTFNCLLSNEFMCALFTC